MRKLKKQDQIIIRKKIDGLLSSKEEAHFNDLIQSSPEARNFYRQEVILHHALEFDSARIPEIDLTDRILQAADPGSTTRRSLPGEFQLYRSFNRRQILSYAAILMIGLLLGSIATYLGTTPGKMPDTDNVSGTLAKPAGNGFSFHEGDTGIKIQDYKSGEFWMLIVDMETEDPVLCSVRDGKQPESSPTVQLLFSEGSFQITGQDESEQNYLCRGKNVFAISTVDRFDKGTIRFTMKGKLICDYIINQE